MSLFSSLFCKQQKMEDNVIVVLRSIPHGVDPLPIKVKHAPIVISILTAALMLICGFFYKFQVRLPEIPFIQEMLVGDIQGFLSSVVFGISCFIVSLIFTGAISSIIVNFDKNNYMLTIIMRILTVVIVISMVLVVCVTPEESYSANYCFVLILSFSLALFFWIITFTTYSKDALALFFIRLILSITAVICVGCYCTLSTQFWKSISQYIYVSAIIIMTGSLYKELSNVFVDIVVI